MIKIHSYNKKSKSVKTLRRLLDQVHNEQFLQEATILINFGSTNRDIEDKTTFNKPSKVVNAVDKRRTLCLLHLCGVSTLKYFNTSDSVYPAADKYYLRTLEKSSGGRGIIIVNRGEEEIFNNYPNKLVTIGIDKKAEYRVHLVKTKQSDVYVYVNKKIIPNGVRLSKDICNKASGYTFKKTISLDEYQSKRSMVELAIEALEALQLDFCSVDIIEDKQGNYYVCEVNTATGIEGSCSEAFYKSALTNMMLSSVYEKEIVSSFVLVFCVDSDMNKIFETFYEN